MPWDSFCGEAWEAGGCTFLAMQQLELVPTGGFLSARAGWCALYDQGGSCSNADHWDIVERWQEFAAACLIPAKIRYNSAVAWFASGWALAGAASSS